MKIKGDVIGNIYRTYDYGIFKRLEGNRGRIEQRAKKVVSSINDIGLLPIPIVVNEKGEVIDGQARVEACKRLGEPVYYCIVRGLGYSECTRLNQDQTNWNMTDYINSLAEKGQEPYKYLKTINERYSKLPFFARVFALDKTYNGTSAKIIKGGKFEATEDDYFRALDKLDYAEKFMPIFQKMKGRREYYYSIVEFCYDLQEINNERLLKNVERYQTSLAPAVGLQQVARELEGVYNIRLAKKVFLETEYRKAAIEKSRRAKR